MSEFTESTLTSPRSPLFSDSDPPDPQSASEFLTSDEEPDLGAFTAVLRAWGHLQPPLRIPTHFLSSSSSRTRSTPTTITGYPGFGGGDTATVEESTVWNRIPIQNYFDQSVITASSSHPTERAREVLEEVDDDDEEEEGSYSSPPSPSAASEGGRTVEIASEVDAASVRSITLEDGISGEQLVVPVPVTTPLSEGRTVSVASGAESHDDGQTSFTSPPFVPPASPVVSFGPRLLVNDNTLSSFTSGSPMPSRSYSPSNPLLNDNSTISRPHPYPSALSIVSYQPQITRTQSSVFQESPSPAFINGHPFRETTNTSSSPPRPHILPLQSTSRVVSNSSHAESDIINSYYVRGPTTISPPSTDQPASNFRWPSRQPLEIITQPPLPQSSAPGPGYQQRPLQEQQYSPSPAVLQQQQQPQTPSVIDDNSSTSANTEYTPPPSPTTTTSAVLLPPPALQPLLTTTTTTTLFPPSDSSGGATSSHSSTPHTAVDIIVPAPASIVTSTSTSTSTNTTTTTTVANPTRQPSLEEESTAATATAPVRHHPSLASTYREEHRTRRTRGRLDPSMFQQDTPHIDSTVTAAVASTSSPLSSSHFHLLSPNGDPHHEQPSLGYLDSALSFIAAERVKLRDAGTMRREQQQQQQQQQQQMDEEEEEAEEAEGRYTTESSSSRNHHHKIRKNQLKSTTTAPIPAPATSSSTTLQPIVNNNNNGTDSTGDNAATNDQQRPSLSSSSSSRQQQQRQIFPSSHSSRLFSENATAAAPDDDGADKLFDDILTTPSKKSKKKKKKESPVKSITGGITILKRPETNGNSNNTLVGAITPPPPPPPPPPTAPAAAARVQLSGSHPTTTTTTNGIITRIHQEHDAYTSSTAAIAAVKLGWGSSSPPPAPPATATKFDGSATPRAYTYLYGSSSDNQGTVDDDDDNDNDELEHDEGDNNNNERNGYYRSSSNSKREQSPEGGGGGGWYIDKYGRRSRRPVPVFSSVYREFEEQSTTSIFHNSATTPNTSKKQKRASQKSGRGGGGGGGGGGGVALDSDDRDEEDNSGENYTVEEEVEEGEGEERSGDVTGKSKKKKKKKVKKRKIPVTIPLPAGSVVLLSHSRSVPNLRVEGATTTDSALEEAEFDSSDIDLSGSVRFLAAPLSESKKGKKKKERRREAVDPLDFHRNAPPPPPPEVVGGGAGFAQSKRARLVWLARRLQTLFPEEQAPLRKVIANLDKQSVEAVAEKKKKKKKSGKAMLDDYSLEYSSLADSDLQRAGLEEEEDPDPRGNVPGKADTLVHVFIDHSNILFGLITHLKRLSRKQQKLTASPSKPFSAYPVTNTGSRPLPIPKTKAGIPVPDTQPLIPLPSFTTANISRSAPSTSFIKNLAHSYGKDISSDGDEHEQSGYDDDQLQTFEADEDVYGYKANENEGQKLKKNKIKMTVKEMTKRIHMWHAALALVLERGRPVTRRVVVASSPLYQPMEDIERLGYGVSVLARVPDFGDGADRLEKAAKFDHYSKKDKELGGSPNKASLSLLRAGRKTHVRGNSDTVFSTSSVAGPSSGQHSRVKFREQGVDELLQLKLHQAVAATDNVPVGATIILATGDGNVAQFNEDGYLGSVRYALKRGWKIELCAWEGGLSRSWRREFGPTSEWGKKGLFRIIAMEQFAEYLVDLGGL